MNATKRKTAQMHGTLRILPRRGHSVKATIIGSGVRLGDLARASNLAPSSFSHYLSARVRNLNGQLAIWRAFRRLTGRRITMREFWGELLAREVA